jgi:DNA-binding protein
MESSIATFYLNKGSNTEELKNKIQELFKSKYTRTVVLIARGSFIDEAVQLTLVIKNEVVNGLHQTTKLSLVTRN